MAIGQCRSGGITVVTASLTNGVQDQEEYDGPPLLHRSYPIWAWKKMTVVLKRYLEVVAQPEFDLV